MTEKLNKQLMFIAEADSMKSVMRQTLLIDKSNGTPRPVGAGDIAEDESERCVFG